MEQPNVAIYLDFENLAISALEVYRGIEKPLKIEPIIKFAQQKGNVRIKKVYADWSKKKFSLYQKDLLSQGFELIHLPETNLLGKNGSDMRLVIDVMEQLQEDPRPEVVVIGSGDSDFIPLIQHMLNRNIEVVLLSFEHSVSEVVKQFSSEFGSLKKIIGKPNRPIRKPTPQQTANTSPESEKKTSPSPTGKKAPTATESPEYREGRNILLRFLREKNPKGFVSLSNLKRELLELEPNFSEEKLGFQKFKKFVKTYKGDLVTELKKQDRQWVIRFVPLAEKQVEETKELETKESKQSPDPKPSPKAMPPKELPGLQQARMLIKKVGKSQASTEPMPLAKLKLLMLRQQPDFSERKLGYRLFKQFVEDMTGDVIERISEEGHTVYVHFPQEKNGNNHETAQLAAVENGINQPATREAIASVSPPSHSPALQLSPSHGAQDYLKDTLRYFYSIELRIRIAKALLNAFEQYPLMTLKQIESELSREFKSQGLAAVDFQTYLEFLRRAGLFVKGSGAEKLSSRLLRLKAEVRQTDRIDEAYLEQVGLALAEKFPDLSTEELLDLLFQSSTSVSSDEKDRQMT